MKVRQPRESRRAQLGSGRRVQGAPVVAVNAASDGGRWWEVLLAWEVKGTCWHVEASV